MIEEIFTKPGKFYRGNLHTHSNNSDGALPAEEVCKRYKKAGYDFISLTDHFVGAYNYPISDTVPFRDENFTTILGAELHSGAMENGELWHILAVGLPADFAPTNSPAFVPIEGQESGPELAQRARDAGAYVAIAHPEWSGLSHNDALSIEAAHAVEVYNHGCHVECDRGRGLHSLDLLLSEGRRYNLCATDDAHFLADDYFGGWVMVKAEANEPDQLLEALKAGHSYASQGPDFHSIDWQDNQVEISCSEVASIIVQGAGCTTVAKNGDSLTNATISLERFTNRDWFRVTVIDKNGKRAWSNPHWRV